MKYAEFMGVLGQFITPLSYIKIKHPVKPWFDWYVPLLLTLLACFLLFILPKGFSLLGGHGLVFIITDLVKILVGFYIASLAAIATFQKPDMDEMLSGEPATLDVKRKGHDKIVSLSRRRFLCFLFGYLAFMGIVIYFAGALATLLASNFTSFASGGLGGFIRWLFTFCYIFLTANLISTTMLGLHFMTDRIHR